jgi:hypothetical protein
MVKKIIELAFEKAKNEVINKNKANYARYIVSTLDEKIRINEKSIVRLYDKYILGSDKTYDERDTTINVMCVFLGYNNYADFIKKNKKETIIDDNLSIKKRIAKIEVTNLDKIKIEVTNTNKTKKGSNAIIPILLIVFGLLAIIIGINLFNKKSSNQITINNFNANKNYYYYTTPQGNIKLTDNPNIKNVKPLTNKVLNTYLTENKIDTTSKKVKLIKAQYFNNGWKNIPLEKITNSKAQKPNSKPQALKNNVDKPKTLLITVKSKNIIDKQLEKKLFKKFETNFSINNSLTSNYQLTGNSQYNFIESNMTKERIICTLTLNYSIINKNNNNIVLSDTKQVKGTGFSKETAKQNTINKLKL